MLPFRSLSIYYAKNAEYGNYNFALITHIERLVIKFPYYIFKKVVIK